MDETTKAIIDQITIRFAKPTRISSGEVVSVFYDCFQLTPNDYARLAAHALGHLEHDAFDIAVGLAYSGILYAAAVAGGRKVVIMQKDGHFFGPDMRGQRVVIADDVVHTGRHLANAAERVTAQGGIVVGFACLIDRSRGKAKLPAQLWSAMQTEME
jgi:orotate phosphoribosyltransferase